MINVLNSEWAKMPMWHRVVRKLRQPFIFAGEVVDYNNLWTLSSVGT